jgi:hypothetical protein
MRGAWGGGLALVAALMLAIGATGASAATPVLEFTSPLAAFPIGFTAEGGGVTAVMSGFGSVVHCSGSSGEGEITGPRSTTGLYSFTGCETEGGSECQSAGALAEEIRTPLIDAELVFTDQAKKEVAMLLDPHRGVYMEFKCFLESVKAFGPFLSPVGPINQESSSFTASLGQTDATQVPASYETLTGERVPAVPSGERGSEPAASTGVELSFAIHTALPLTVKAISAAEVEAKQRDEEAAAKKRHDDEEAAKTAAAKKHDEEEAARKRTEEEIAKARERERTKEKARLRQRSKALKQCRKADSKASRVRCERRAKKRYAPPKTAKA